MFANEEGMTSRLHSIDAFAAARGEVDDQIKAVEAQLDAPNLSPDVAEHPGDGIFRALQILRDHDRNEIKVESLREFAWHLSLVEALVVQLPLENSPPD